MSWLCANDLSARQSDRLNRGYAVRSIDATATVIGGLPSGPPITVSGVPTQGRCLFLAYLGGPQLGPVACPPSR
jgi:hypothetical protein